MDNFEANVTRACAAFQYVTPQEFMTTLVEEGIVPDEAFLIIKAALI